MNAVCLGMWLDSNLTGKKAIKENVKNARKVFFSFRSVEAFHGQLNPLSGKSISRYVILIAPYGCEL